MAEAGLIPNKSYEIFVLGDSISNYLHLPHRIDFYDDDPYICHDTYYFDNFNFEVWVENGKIETICCDIECYWQDKNLIKMYEEGLIDFSKIKTFNLDEYYKLPIDNDQSYHYFMDENLFNHINISFINNKNTDL